MSNFATITGALQNSDGNPVTSNCFVRCTLRGCNGNQPRVGSVALIAPGGGLTYFQDFTPNASGAILDGGSPALLFGNDVISAGGSTGVTWWGVAIYINGIPAGETPYTFNSNTSYDLTTAIPNTTNPVIPTPTGDSTYLRLDGGNNPMTGQVAAKNGTAASPGLAFASDLTTGFARQAASVIGGAIAGTFRWLLSATGELLGSGGAYGWSSNADPSLAAGDSFLARISAKILGIGSTNGGTDGELRLAKVNKVTITQPATGSTLTIADGKTATVNNSLTLAGTDGTTQTFQASDTIVGRATTDTVSNKTMTGAASGNSVTLLNIQLALAPITGTGAAANIYSFSVPANTMGSGKGIRVKAWWQHTTGTASVAYTVTFGGTTIHSFSSVSTGAGFFAEEYIFNNAGVQNAQTTAGYESDSNVQSTGASSTTAVNTALAQTVAVTFSVAATDQVTPKMFLVELIQ